MGNAKALIDSPIGDRYTEIAVPTIVIHGDSDIVDPLEDSALPMVETIQNCEPRVMQHVNYFPSIEAPSPGFNHH